MISRFLRLEWKQFFRSSYWQKNVALNILLIFFAFWMMISFLAFGFGLYPMLQKLFPDNDPFVVANNYLFFWVLTDLFFRFFLQKLPVMSVKPLLTLPLKKSSIVNYVLGKSAVNFFNFLPLFAAIPFSITLVTKGHDSSVILTWLSLIILLTLIINFLNFIVESLSAEIELSFLPIIAFAGGLFAFDYFNLIDLSKRFSDASLTIANNSLLIVVPVLVLLLLYQVNFYLLRKKLVLDQSLALKSEVAKTSNLDWTRRFGVVAPFMQLDIRLLLRNKRTKSSLWILAIGLLYGLFFYPQPMYQDKTFLFAFIGIFVTGIFLINFGQFIPAWDSGYYKMLMSQNLHYKDYLKSKYTLMSLSVVILFLLSIPYVYFGWKILIAHFGAAIYNIGVNTHIMLYGGSFNRKKIDLNQKAAFNYQGTGAVQWIIGIPLMVIPMIIFGLVNWALNFEAAIATLVGIGFAGIVLHDKIMVAITHKYQSTKYKMIDAFSQNT